MKGAVIRLAIVSGLFVLWLGYLAFLTVLTPREPVILCRPQFLQADLVVIALVENTGGPADVLEVIHPAKNKQHLSYAKLRHESRGMCPAAAPAEDGEPKDFTGPGQYILPLREVPGNAPAVDPKDREYEVAATPPAPGYPATGLLEPGPPQFIRQRRRRGTSWTRW